MKLGGMRVIFLAGLVLACLAPATAQEAPKVARTPDGHPDLQGVWTTRFITRLERPREAKSLEVSPEEEKVVVDAMLVRSNSPTTLMRSWDGSCLWMPPIPARCCGSC